MASARSLYDVLNVSHDAEGVVIEAAYRALMKKYHPDQAPGGESDGNSSAAEINQAFAILRDPRRRAGYDRHEANEWSRNRPVQLTEPAFQPPPRRSGFAWTGWLVALLLGAILYAVLNGRGGLIVPPAAGNDGAAAQLDNRAERVKMAPALVDLVPTALDREAALSESRAAAARRRQAALDEAAAAAAAREAAEIELPPIEIEEPAQLQMRARPAPSSRHARPERRKGSAGARSREDEDFLKREGYIY